jgi:hypothetical protein
MIQDAFTNVMGGTNATTGALQGQLITTLGTTKSTNAIDLAPTTLGGNQVRDMAAGEPIRFTVMVLEQPTSAGAATVRFQLVSADDVTMTTNLQVLSQTGDLTIASLTLGKVLLLTLGRISTPRRYLGMQVVVGTAGLTNANGQFFANVARDVSTPTAYSNSGFKII